MSDHTSPQNKLGPASATGPATAAATSAYRAPGIGIYRKTAVQQGWGGKK